MCDTANADQRSAILRIKEVWHRLPTDPDQVGALQLYTALPDDGVRAPQQFATWLAARRYHGT